MVLLWGPTGWQFLMSEVALYAVTWTRCITRGPTASRGGGDTPRAIRHPEYYSTRIPLSSELGSLKQLASQGLRCHLLKR